MWKALGSSRNGLQALVSNRSGGVVLAIILGDQRRNPTTLEDLGFQESILVGSWYIWWQRRKVVKGEGVATPSKTALAIL